MNANTDFARLLAKYFTSWLIGQRQVSPHTVASYRDTFRLLALYAKNVLKISPQDLTFDDLDVEFLVEFLNHLEHQRGNCARSRNARLAAIRAFFRYVALQEPRYAMLAQQVLSMPSKRHDRKSVNFLDYDQIEALLQATDPNTRIGRRDHCLLLIAVQTGMRASEIIALRRQDIHMDSGAHARCFGKGRKTRCVPLRKDSLTALKEWFQECAGEPSDPVFLNQRGRALTHDSLDYLLKKNLAVARDKCPALRDKRVTPHTLRHTAAMELLRNGVDRATIALWLGHEQIETTYIYLHADLKLKEQAMARTTPSGTPIGKYQPEDAVLAYLNNL